MNTLAANNISRRAFIIGSGASAATLSINRQLALAARPKPALDLLAVRVFPSYRPRTYADHEAVLLRLRNLGIKRISHQMSPSIAGRSDVISFTRRAYYEYGIKSWFTMGVPRVLLTASEWTKIVRCLDGPLAGIAERIYGWNEPNHNRSGGDLPSDWHIMTGIHQRELFKRLKPLGLKIGTPQLWSGNFDTHDNDLVKLAPYIQGSFDHIGWHLYPRGSVGENLITRFENFYEEILGQRYPVVCTEAGYFTAPNYRGGAVKVTEQEQALLIPKLAQAYTSRNYGLSYFELLDDPDPTGANREASLGLIRTPSFDSSTWRRKPAFKSLKQHLASLT